MLGQRAGHAVSSRALRAGSCFTLASHGIGLHVTISDFVRITRANLALLVACLILGGVAGYFYQLGLPRLYAADAAGYVVGGRATTTFDAQQSQTLAAQKAASYTGLVSTRGVGERIVKDLKLNASPMEVAGKLSASVDQGSVLFRITAVSTDPKEAQTLANAAIRATSAQANLIESGGNPSAADPVVKIIPLESALLPGAPFTPNRDKYIQTGLAAGLAGGYVLVFLRRVLDRRVRHSGELEQMLNTSVLGIIPKVSELAGRRRGGGKPLGNAAESMRQLRTNLRFIDVDSKPRSIVVTSPNPGEGKSTVAANLARVLAASGQPTVLIDADLRRPMVGTVFDIDGSVGLTQTLAGDVPVADVMQTTSLSNLFIIPAGRIPPNPTELLGSQRMRDLVETLGEKYLVILDAPPMLPVTDAALLTANVKVTWPRTKPGRSTRSAVACSARS